MYAIYRWKSSLPPYRFWFEMPGLSHSLNRTDFSYLQIIAGFWEIQLEARDLRQALEVLVPALLEPEAVREMVESLPVEARLALDDLIQNQGRLPWPKFTRRYGIVREMGPGRRDRDRPHLKPVSPAEILWYRALIARAFFDTSSGHQEFAYIPDDLLALVPAGMGAAPASLGRAATPAERAHLIPISDELLDEACTLLAALRLGIPHQEVAAIEVELAEVRPGFPLSSPALEALLRAASLLDEQGVPRPESTRSFLESARGASLAQLFKAWVESSTFDELRLVPGLRVEGELENDPNRTRKLVLDFLSSIPGSKAGEKRIFWSLPAFVDAIRYNHPEFLRPTGDYDSWFIRDLQSDQFLRGFQSWDAVEGALLHFILTGPLHGLGMLDLATSVPGGSVTAFRFSTWALDLLAGKAPTGLPVEDQPVQARPDGRIFVPRLAPRAARYQLARFCAWEKQSADGYRYRLTPASLERARQQGLTLPHLLGLLRRYAQPLSPGLVKILERWEQKGTEARFQRLVVLRLSSPELLTQLRTSRAARFLGDPLGPTAVIVKPAAVDKVMAVLAEMGYLGEAELEE
jgi:hypothetical protein